MKTFRCECGNRLFFDNTQCVQCGLETGLCPQCHRMGPLVADASGRLVCGHADCAAPLRDCRNRAEGVCNQRVCDDVAPPAGEADSLCAACALTAVIPDLTVPGNREKWARLEAAKRRVLFSLRRFELPFGTSDNDVPLKLSFEFKASGAEAVYTGHAHGVITINVDEADDVERERARVTFGEPHRTLVGHFRHELGHYYWDLLVKDRCEEEFRALFGDERDPDYATAQARYYEQGPAADWGARHISAYASMHPWEDFAETFGAYLDMLSILDTASHLHGHELQPGAALDLLTRYQQVGILVNELNREMGLHDLVPEVFNAIVGEKLSFIHDLVLFQPACWESEAVAAS